MITAKCDGTVVNGIWCIDYGYEYGLFRQDRFYGDAVVIGYWKTLQRVNQTANRYGVEFVK